MIRLYESAKTYPAICAAFDEVEKRLKANPVLPPRVKMESRKVRKAEFDDSSIDEGALSCFGDE